MTPVAAHWSAFNFPLVFPCQLPQDLPTFGSRLAPRKACATFEGHLRVQMCFVADSSKWRGDVCKACKCSSHPSRRSWERKKCCSQIGTNYGTLVRSWLVIISFLLVLTLYTLRIPSRQRWELPRVGWSFAGFLSMASIDFLGQTRRKSRDFSGGFRSLLIPFSVETSIFIGDWDNFEPRAGRFSASSFLRDFFSSNPPWLGSPLMADKIFRIPGGPVVISQRRIPVGNPWNWGDQFLGVPKT